MLDLLLPFLQSDAAPFHAQDPGQPSAEGYTLSAGLIAELLAEQGWLHSAKGRAESAVSCGRSGSPAPRPAGATE